MKVADYNDSVFINCPFDEQYVPILRAIVYTVYRCGFFPKTALDEDDGSDNRLAKIIRKIRDSRYGIHDLSRIELSDAAWPRFNMPFELGIFFGAKNLGDDQQKKKNALVLERDKYSYQKYISDLNGIDTKAHNNDPETAMKKVRDWLRTASGRKTIPGYSILADQYKEFLEHLPELLNKESIVSNIPQFQSITAAGKINLENNTVRYNFTVSKDVGPGGGAGRKKNKHVQGGKNQAIHHREDGAHLQQEGLRFDLVE